MLATVRGTKLFFDVDGVQFAPIGDRLVERPVVFLLHGGPGGDHASFKTQAAALRDVAQLVFVDHRGSGRSATCPAGTCTLDNNIDDIDALREYLGLERITVLGSSYGGMVAQGYAIRYPDRVANLILCVTAPSHEFLPQAQEILNLRGTDDQRRVCEWLWNGSFESLEQLREYYYVMGPMYSLAFDEAKFAQSWGRGIRNFEQLNFGFSTFLRTFDFRDRLPDVGCPTLVIGGAHDWICPPAQSRIIADLIPRAHLKIFANSSHAVAADEPAEFLAAVRGFLTYAQ